MSVSRFLPVLVSVICSAMLACGGSSSGSDRGDGASHEGGSGGSGGTGGEGDEAGRGGSLREGGAGGESTGGHGGSSEGGSGGIGGSAGVEGPEEEPLAECAPNSPPPESKGSCMVTEWFCIDWVGPSFDPASVKRSCGPSDGTYSPSGCDKSRANYLGGCRTSCGDDDEVFWGFYAPPNGDPATIRSTQRAGCIEKGNTWVDK